MMKIRVVLVLCATFLFSSCFTACPFNNSLKPDNEIFGNFEALHFEGTYSDDDYIIASALHPAQIQVWKRTNKNTVEESAELIRVYSFEKGEFNKEGTRNIWPMSVAMLHGNIWICGEGVQKNFMRLNMATGELKFLKLDCTPSSVFVVPKEEDGIGTLWIATRSAQGVGIAIRMLDDDGNIIRRYNVKHDDLNVMLQTMYYCKEDETYNFLADSYNYFSSSSNTADQYFKYISLSASLDYEVTSISYNDVYTHKTKQDVLSELPNEFFASLSIRPSSTFSKAKFISSSVISSDPYIRKSFMYKVNSIKPFVFEHIKLESDSYIHYFAIETEKNILTLSTSWNNSTYRKTEIYIYSPDNGIINKKIFLPFVGEKVASYDNKTWFSKSVYVQDQTTREWIDTGRAIYRLDHDMATVWKINADGTKEEMKAEPAS